jgi:STE24 endopeptidase
VGQVSDRADATAGLPRSEAARRLAAARRRLFLASTAAGLVVPWLLWASGLSDAAWRALAGLPLGHWPDLALYVESVLGLLAIVGLPFGWYGGYRLAHRFGLSRQTPRAWFTDWLKAALLGLALSGLAIVALYAIFALAGAAWWLLFAGLTTLAMILLTFVAPYLLVPIFYRMRPLEDAAAVDAVQQLAAAAGARVRNVSTLDFSRKTVEANAAVIGFGRSRRVVLADTLLSEFTLPEIKSVVAHELGHHVHRDVFRLLVVQGALIWAGLAVAAALGQPLLALVGAPGGLAEPESLPLLLVGAELFGLLAMPLANALSRRLEAAADTFALDLTGDPAAFASSMRKLADQNLAETSPPRWAELVLYSHPPIERRIRSAKARQHGQAA